MKPSFEYFCKGLTCEQDRLISSSQLTIGKSLMEHSKKNPHKGFNNNPKPYGNVPTNHTSNDAKQKVFNPCKYFGKTNHPNNI